MKPRFLPALFVFIALLVGLSSLVAQEQKSPEKMSKLTREELIRAFNAELVYIRAPFPMGKKGLTLKDGVISPSGQDLQVLLGMWGPAAKPGDQARISDIVVRNDHIHFEINGGPVKKKKWYQHIEVGGGGGTIPVGPNDTDANPRGSYVDLEFDKYVPELDPKQLKELLRPVFDFDAKSAVEAYLETVPPKVKEAIKGHQVLVGMNREMVIYSKGRPPTKTREKEGEIEWEEWIYGAPPQDVDFVRFVGDEVVRVENMKVDGQKTVRVEKEVDLSEGTAVAKGPGGETDRPVNAPTLRRPGEAVPGANPGNPNPRPPSMPDPLPPPNLRAGG